MRQRVIKNSEPYYDGLFSDNDLGSKAYVDSENSKRDISIADKAIKNDIFFKDANDNLDVGGNDIMNLKPFVEDDDKNESGRGHVIDFSYFHTQRTKN